MVLRLPRQCPDSNLNRYSSNTDSSNYLLNLGVRYGRHLRYRMYFMPFAHELINIIFIPLDLALYLSGLRIRQPPRSLPEKDAIEILDAMIRALASHASSTLSTTLNSTGIAVPDYFTAHDTSLTLSALIRRSRLHTYRLEIRPNSQRGRDSIAKYWHLHRLSKPHKM